MAGEVANKGQNFARLTHPDPLAPPPTPEIYTKVTLNREKDGCARMCVPAAKWFPERGCCTQRPTSTLF